MMPYEPILDIMRRTMANLEFVERHASDDGPFEVTDVSSARAILLDKLAAIAVRLPVPPAQNENAPAEGPAGATSPLEERLALGAGQPMLHTKVLADDAI